MICERQTDLRRYVTFASAHTTRVGHLTYLLSYLFTSLAVFSFTCFEPTFPCRHGCIAIQVEPM